ncbi:hypothetical protein [Pelagibius marinus]|uniref:hypothetical protein n=1 Tax=Pelagibius marinus TaxID=2762760 RepID=UPI001872DE25|nr:hypothetical protein [Pelagibius marinus]
MSAISDLPDGLAGPQAPRAKGVAPRHVANLAFPEVLVIWALRRYTNCRQPREARSAVIAPEFSRALGLAHLEETLAAFSAVADGLMAAARLPQALSVIDDDRINATEEALLSVLAAFQQGETAQARALSEWCLLPVGRRRFVEGAERLARSLRAAAQLIPYQAPRRRELVLGDKGEDAELLASAPDLAALEEQERGVVTAVRLWVSAYRQNEDALAAARRHFGCQFNAAGALWGDPRSGEDAGLSLHAILRNTTLAAHRPVDVRCPTCPGLSPDEARLLEALAWLQRDLGEPAATALGDWLPPAALRLSLAPARGLAQSLLAAEQLLPLRAWDLAALEAAATEPRRPTETTAATQQAGAPARTPTLH